MRRAVLTLAGTAAGLAALLVVKSHARRLDRRGRGPQPLTVPTAAAPAASGPAGSAHGGGTRATGKPSASPTRGGGSSGGSSMGGTGGGASAAAAHLHRVGRRYAVRPDAGRDHRVGRRRSPRSPSCSRPTTGARATRSTRWRSPSSLMRPSPRRARRSTRSAGPATPARVTSSPCKAPSTRLAFDALPHLNGLEAEDLAIVRVMRNLFATFAPLIHC